MRIRHQAALVTGALALAAAWPAEAKQPNPSAEALQMLPDEREPFSRTPTSRISNDTGVPLALYRLSHPVRPGTPEQMARQFLTEAGAQFGLQQADLSDLRFRASRDGRATTTVRFDQTYKGVPVYGADMAITLNRQSQVVFVMNSYKPRVKLDDVTPAIAAEAARAAALRHLRAEGTLNYYKSDLVVYHAKGASRLAYRVALEPSVSPLGYWEALVDARTGALFRVQDKTCYRHAQDAAGAPEVNGSGTVFNLDPLSSSGGATYGSPGLVDGADADTAQLTAQVINVTLRDIDLAAGVHTLKGPWAEVVDFEAPAKGLFTQAGSAFNFTRNADAFEAANTYFHIDALMRYLNDPIASGGLNLAIRPFAYPGGVQFDPSGFNGADNSHYLGGSQRLAFGEGGVDDAEDADVIIHELGHGLHDWVTSGSLSQVEGLSEGTGDYIAQSYSRSLNLVPSGDEHFEWVFNWDGHNPFWDGRVTNWPNHYPDELVGGGPHTDGQIWATANMRIWNLLGRTKTDTAFWEGLGMTNGGTNQEDAAQAMMQAAHDLGYSLGDQTIMLNQFTTTGYTVAIVPVELMSVTVE